MKADPLSRFEEPESVEGLRGPPPEFRKGRQPVQLPADGRLLSDFAEDLGEILADKDIFAAGGQVVVVDPDQGGVKPVDEQMFRTLVEQWATCYRRAVLRRHEEAVIRNYQSMTTDCAKAVKASPQFIRRLRPLLLVNDIPLPVKRESGEVELLPEGYDAASGVFTRHGGDFRNMTLDEGREVIEALLSEFVFADEKRSKAVAVAAMLTAFGRLVLPAKSLRPAFFYLANAPGAGKTLCADCAVVPVAGKAHRLALPRKEEELEKTLLATVMEGRTVLYFDNAKGHLSSGCLEAFLTSVHWKGRILSHSKTFEGPNLATVFVTGNGCTVSPDMRRRSLFVELFNPSAHAERRTFNRPLSEAALVAQRWDILSALWAMVRAWDGAGRPPASQPLNGCGDWSAVIGGIVEHAGFGCPTTAPELASGGDRDLADFEALLRALQARGTTPWTFAEVTETAAKEGLFDRILEGESTLDRPARSAFSKVLAGYDRQMVGTEAPLRMVIEGRGHARRYRIEKAAAAPESGVAK